MRSKFLPAFAAGAACSLAAALIALPASAQSVRVQADSYSENPVIPLAPLRQAQPAPTAPEAIPAGYVLRTGSPIHQELKGWATREGWEFVWHPTVSWKTLRATQFPQTDVAAAVTEVIDILRDEGKPVRLRISEGNKVMEVVSTEVRND